MTDISKEVIAAHKAELFRAAYDDGLRHCTFTLIDAQAARIEQLTDERDRQYDQNAEFIVKIAELEAALAEAVEWNWIDHDEGADDPHSTSRIPEGIAGPILALLDKEPTT